MTVTGEIVVSGTGHRPDKLGGYSEPARLHLISFAETILIEMRPRLVRSGFAQGWDLAMAEAADCLGIPFSAAIPFGGQEIQWPLETQERYRALLKKAVEVKLVSSGGYASWKFQRRNEELVNTCDLLVCLWDGSNGGTANCIKYAKRVGRKFEPMEAAFATAMRDGRGMVNVWDRWVPL